MYVWGRRTGDWKGPGTYKFDSARAPYLDKLAAASAKKGGRTYVDRSAPGKIVDPRGKMISSSSQNVIVFGVDVTGSMADWPGQIFDRLPLLYQTLSQYRDDLEISFGAIGDATCDSYPLQVNDFGKGLALEDHVNALCPEGGGGGQTRESYELFAYFMAEHAQIKATSPFLFICGDEGFYEQVDPAAVKHYIGDTLQSPLDSRGIWKRLVQRFDLYFLQKPYGSGDRSVTAEVKSQWADAIGSQRVIDLPGADRVVDVAMGIVAKKWGQYGDFKDSMTARHDPAVTAGVYHSIRHIDDGGSVHSVIDRPDRPRLPSHRTGKSRRSP